VRTLLIDNYDSYTYNLYQLIAVTYGVEPVVLRNDDPVPDVAGFDAVVISPGPGTPLHARDIGTVRRLLDAHPELPVLGVCLGHQLIAALAGAAVEPAPWPRHGHLTRVRHTGTDLFAGLPAEFTAVRYHSLRVPEPLPASLEALARAEDGVLMGLRHRTLPRWGVQFHPESVGSECGAALLENFRRLCGAPVVQEGAPLGLHEPGRAPSSHEELQVTVRDVDGEADAERVFAGLFADQEYAVWLDSADRGRFSYLGAPLGRLGEVIDSDEVLTRRLAERAVAPMDLPFDLVGG
jgi:para-aminobenzoate synthetase